MKIASDESNGPVSPVWHSLKGLSSRDAGQMGPLSPGIASLAPSGFTPLSDSSFGASPPVLARSSRSSFNASVNAGAPRTASCISIEPEGPSTYKSQDSLETPLGANALQITSCGLSSSTTSTTLSNPNLMEQNNVPGLRGPLGLLNTKDTTVQSASKDDSQAFSLFDGIANPFFDLYRHSRLNSKKLRRRIVHKNGECNITKANVAKRRKRFLQDLFTTLLDIQWRWTLLVFALSFVISWILFAAIWYAIVYNHGDLLPYHLPDKQQESGWTPCVMNIFSFASCFLFSVETQHTIGYGSRHTTEECPEAIFVMCIQSITGVILQAFMGGVIFTKLSRPKKRANTLIFSRQACICQRDGELCLLFRVGDMRKSHIIEAHIRVQLIKQRVTEEGENIPYYQYELDVGYDGGEDRILFIWPMTIVHKIDESSPLYELSAHDLAHEKFEIIVMLEGVIENTGMTIQARSSYLPLEIKWGYRFRPMLTFREDIGGCTVDYSLFNEMYEVVTPLCSAKYLQEYSSAATTPVTPSTPLSPRSPFTPSTKTCDGATQSGCSSVAGSLSRMNSLVSPRSGGTNSNVAKSIRKNSSNRRQRNVNGMISTGTTTDELEEPGSHRSLGRCDSQSTQPLLEPLGQV